MPLKTIEARREYQRARRAKLRAVKAANIVVEEPPDNIIAPPEPPEVPNEVSECQSEDQGEDQSEEVFRK